MFIVELFCHIDDFCKTFISDWESKLIEGGEKKRRRQRQLSISEIMTILVAFHSSGFRTFKHFYSFLLTHHRDLFPSLVGYTRFISYIPSVIVPLTAYLNTRKGQVTGIGFVDSTAIAVCKNGRILSNRVFRGLAKRGKTTTGWFFGFKCHIIINDRGELLAFCITPGNTDDRVPLGEKLAKGVTGKLFGDKGYVSKELFEKLLSQGLTLFTHIKKNMKNSLMPLIDKILLRKRSLVETVNDQLKNISQIEHSRHRSPTNFLVNFLCALISYSHQPKKPSMNLDLGLIAP